MSTTVAKREFIRVFGGTLARVETPAEKFEIRSEPSVVGRAAECALVLDDSTVSSAHFEVTATERGVRIRDSGSRNGTFVNGDECVEMYLLQPGQVQAGDVMLQFLPAVAPVEVEASGVDLCGTLFGSTDDMRRLFHRIRKVAQTDVTALITGETGTGKELVAKAIHMASPWAHGPFVVLDCSAVTPSLIESSLFGHMRGSFTGADRDRVGVFEEADGGTLFLDELGELPIDLQPRLLRAVQEKKVKPVGANSYRQVNVRLLAATRRDLPREINAGGFRSDLYFRLAQFKLELPPLRQRKQDIPGLVAHIGRELGFADADRRLSADALTRLMAHDWPGNVRELKNVVQVALKLAEPAGRIEVDEYMTPESRRVNESRVVANYEVARAEAIAEFERTYWQNLVAASDGNQSEIARMSGSGRAVVRRHLATWNLLGKVKGE